MLALPRVGSTKSGAADEQDERRCHAAEIADFHSNMAKPAHIVSAMFQGGGNIRFLMPIMTRLVETGPNVRIMAGTGVRRSGLQVRASFLH
jgi:hypothetical protein